MKHWVFDLDGTLIDSLPPYRRVLTKVLKEYKVDLTDQHLKLARHLVLPKFLEMHISKNDVPEATKKALALSIETNHEISPYPGIMDLVSFLSKTGKTLSIWTAREKSTADDILVKTGLGKYFSILVSRDCVLETKPNPEGLNKILNFNSFGAEDTVMIGDHKMDMEGAKNAGVKGISVCWDGEFHEQNAMSDLHFTNVSDLHAWAKLNS